MRSARFELFRHVAAALACYALLLGGLLDSFRGPAPAAPVGIVCGHDGGAPPERGPGEPDHEGLCCTAACASQPTIPAAPDACGTAGHAAAATLSWRTSRASPGSAADVPSPRSRGPPSV